MHLDARSQELVRTILRQHLGLRARVFVFGSRAHGRRLKPFSDLDLCIRGIHLTDPECLAALNQAFVDSDLPVKVDVVDWHALSEEFQLAIADDLTPLLL